MILLETGSTSPYYNLAFEEYILTHLTEEDYLILWQNDNTIVVGQNQNTREEINHAFVEEHGINVVRRSTGGGAVYHDLGNLNYSFITDLQDAKNLTIEPFIRKAVAALKALGLDAQASGRNDILVDGQKVSGTAQHISRKRILHHGTLLFDSDISFIAEALNADPEKFKSKSAKSVKSRVGNIRDALKEDMSMADFKAFLENFFCDEEGLRRKELSEEDLEQIRILQREKYDTWQWNYGKSPKYDYANKKRFSGGTVDLRASVKKGVITDIKFYGDFLSAKPLDDLENALLGCRFLRDDIAEVLERFPIQEFFGAITTEELLSLME
jgi:lipoate-protein ligase A